MFRKFLRELKLIRKELQAIESSMESFKKTLTIDNIDHQLGELQTARINRKSLSESLMSKTVNIENCKVRTNEDDKLTAECTAKLNKALRDIAGFEALDKIEKVILEMYTEIKKQGSVLTGIENLHCQLCFRNPELAAHIKKRMLEIAKENGDLP